jgi:Eukaryotic phosphomannomutase
MSWTHSSDVLGDVKRNAVGPKLRDFWYLTILAVASVFSGVRYCSSTLFPGSDLPKQEEQLGEGIVNVFPYNFSQNGLVAYKNGSLLEVQTMAGHIGEDNVKRIVNWTLRYVADLDIPIKVRICWQ